MFREGLASSKVSTGMISQEILSPISNISNSSNGVDMTPPYAPAHHRHPDSSDGTSDFLMTAPEQKRRSIDAAKYKTKMCRNFVMGIPCPFNEKCAFSHGDDDAYLHCLRLQTSAMAGGFSHSASSIASTSGTAADADNAPSGHHHTLRADAMAFVPSAIIFPPGDMESPAAGPFVSTPSLNSEFTVNEDTSSESSHRFRYDPYSPSGIVMCG